MTDQPILSPTTNTSLARKASRRRWLVLLVPLLILGGLLWASNWFYQRSRLFQGSHIVLGDPLLPWGKLIGDDTARELFGIPVELHPDDRLTSYQLRLVGGYTPLNDLALRDVTDADVYCLRGLVNLENLNLYDAGISDGACDVIGQFRGLRHVTIAASHNDVKARITDDGVKALAGLKELRHLYLQSPDVTDDALQYIGQLKALESLTLADARINGASLHELSQLANLRHLNLANCPLAGDCLGQLSGNTALFTLTLYGSTVTDEMLPSLIPIRSLRIVNLDKTMVTTEGCLSLLKARPDLNIWNAENERILLNRDTP